MLHPPIPGHVSVEASVCIQNRWFSSYEKVKLLEHYSYLRRRQLFFIKRCQSSFEGERAQISF